MTDPEIKVGQQWRRKKDGKVVTVTNAVQWYTQIDVHWRSDDGKRGAIWSFNFRKNYELVTP